MDKGDVFLSRLSGQGTTYSQLPTIEEGKSSRPSSPTRSSSPSTSSSISETASSRSSHLQTGVYIVIWIISSNSTILFNKWLIDTAGFSYPILLTCWHLTFAALVTQVLARTTTLLDSRHKLPISGRFYLRTILPIGLTASVSLICSNVVYMYLSVAFIQMLKASSPAAVLFVSWLLGVNKPTMGAVVNIMFIVFGVALASAGAIEFSWLGLAFQLCGVLFEAVRVVLIQIMLKGEGLQMDALVGLYYYAPACAAMNFIVACVVEVPRFQMEDLINVGPWVLVLNALVAFLLNFASMVLIGKTSGLVTTLTGIFKNILLIICSVILWGTQISPIQIVGYSMGLVGLVYYSFGYDKLAAGASATATWVASLLSSSEKSRISPRVRVALLVASVCLLSTVIAVGYMNGYGKSITSIIWSTESATDIPR
jgi:drug/metabolite transporter (DMT)-like permease